MKNPIIAIALLLWAMTAQAWGNLGHRITGAVAEPLLTTAARSEVNALLQGESLASAATYMDTARDELKQRWPQAARWHYDNRAVCGSKDYCRDGQCASAQLIRWQSVLANRRASRDERALALKLLIHLVGDIHQPLHMADADDRGGNDLNVRLYSGAERRSLHAVLDTDLLRQLVGRARPERYAQQLTQRYSAQLSSWSRGTPTDWQQESHQLAAQKVYGLLPGFRCGGGGLNRTLTLPYGYVDEANAYLPEQLTKAGVRMAMLLNATLR